MSRRTNKGPSLGVMCWKKADALQLVEMSRR